MKRSIAVVGLAAIVLLGGGLRQRIARRGFVVARLAKRLFSSPRCAASTSVDSASAAGEARLISIVAHPDDDLLFINPAIDHAIKTHAYVQTVYLTAGDAGRRKDYWQSREEGIRAAYAQMACAPNRWNENTLIVGEKTVHEYELNDNPRVSVVFLRLPDGNGNGEGFDKTSDDDFRPPFTSLYKLWAGEIGSLPVVGTWYTAQGDSYTASDLIKVLGALLSRFGAKQIATMDGSAESASGQDFFYGREHSDHLHGAKFAFEAQLAYATSHELTIYRDYSIADPPRTLEAENLSPAERNEKLDIFTTYACYDGDTCVSGSHCTYPLWSARQYAIRQITGTAGWLSLHPGECLDSPAGLSTEVRLHDCADVSQQWILAGNRIQTSGANGPKCLDLKGADRAVGATLQIADCRAEAPSQSWTLTDNGMLRGLGGRCVSATAGDAGASVRIAACRRQSVPGSWLRYTVDPQQRWRISHARPSPSHGDVEASSP